MCPARVLTVPGIGLFHQIGHRNEIPHLVGDGIHVMIIPLHRVGGGALIGGHEVIFQGYFHLQVALLIATAFIRIGVIFAVAVPTVVVFVTHHLGDVQSNEALDIDRGHGVGGAGMGRLRPQQALGQSEPGVGSRQRGQGVLDALYQVRFLMQQIRTVTKLHESGGAQVCQSLR